MVYKGIMHLFLHNGSHEAQMSLSERACAQQLWSDGSVKTGHRPRLCGREVVVAIDPNSRFG